MRTIEKVLEYLEPYTKMDGIYLDKLVEVYQYQNVVSVEIDIKSAFKPVGEDKRIKGFLRRNGFEYGFGHYTRIK